jgi:excisionase family DNA binding protein
MMEQQRETLPIWLTVDQAAARAQVGPGMIYAAARNGKLRVARLGGRRCLRFRPEWVDAWCEQSSEPREIGAR